LLLLPFAVLMPRVRWNRALIGISIAVIFGSSIMLFAGLETLFSAICDGLVIFGLWWTRPTMQGKTTVEPDAMAVT
jgi:hypothetical protein